MEPIERRTDSRSMVIAASPAQVFAAIRTPERLARWWGPDGFTNTIHELECAPGGRWRLTMHGPDGTDHPNESRVLRVVPDEVFEIAHVSGHRFVLTIELAAAPGGTLVRWRQTFESAGVFEPLAAFLAAANQQNLERLAREVAAGGEDDGA